MIIGMIGFAYLSMMLIQAHTIWNLLIEHLSMVFGMMLGMNMVTLVFDLFHETPGV